MIEWCSQKIIYNFFLYDIFYNFFEFFETILFFENEFFFILFLLFCLLIYFFFKLTFFPFYYWILEVYNGSNILSLIFLKFFYNIFIFYLLHVYICRFFNIFLNYWEDFFLFICLITLFSIFFFVIFENNIKRFFILSSISHSCYIFIGYALYHNTGIEAGLFYIIGYFITGISIWFFLLYFNKKIFFLTNTKNLGNISNLFINLLSFIFLSFSGLPPLLGFFLKYNIINSLFNNEFIFYGSLILIISIIHFIYYARFIKIIKYDLNYLINIYWETVHNIKILLFFIFFILWMIVFPFFFMYELYYLLIKSIKIII